MFKTNKDLEIEIVNFTKLTYTGNHLTGWDGTVKINNTVIVGYFNLFDIFDIGEVEYHVDWELELEKEGYLK